VYPRVLDIDLPSWVPDFSHRASATINSSISSLKPVSVDSNPVSTVSFKDETGRISVRGFIVHYIDGLAHILGGTTENTFHESSSRSIIYNGLEAIHAICQSLVAGNPGSLPPMQTPTLEMLQDLSNIFIRQCRQYGQADNSNSDSEIFAGWDHHNQNLIMSGKAIKQWAHEVSPLRNDPTTSHIQLRDFFDCRSSRHWNSRRMITTAAGHVGLGGNTCETGDVICVICGCSTPIVLRRKKNAFRVVGEAYVHGIMDGEAFKGIHYARF
jgi:hypothetical protein